MADYYTEFSFVIKDVTQEEAEWLLELYNTAAMKDGDFEGEEFKHCFDMEIHQEPDMNAWFHSGDGSPNIDVLAGFIQGFLSKFRPNDEIFFQWSSSCSKPRLDAYGGGAMLITSKRWVAQNTADLMEQLQEEIKKAG
jgi:hypothetical protein